eukprot:8276053-Pyramimonas_sp.AAC.1
MLRLSRPGSLRVGPPPRDLAPSWTLGWTAATCFRQLAAFGEPPVVSLPSWVMGCTERSELHERGGVSGVPAGPCAFCP